MRITNKEFLDFIKAQPNNRRVDMQQSSAYNDNCGCLLIQFYRQKFPNTKNAIYAGYSNVYEAKDLGGKVIELNFNNSIGNLIKGLCRWKPTTYFKVKSLLPNFIKV